MNNTREDVINQVDGIAITSETLGYSPAEMTACPRCGKPNAPNRFGCFYCGAEMRCVADIEARLQINPTSMEAWERGFNIVHLGHDDGDSSKILSAIKLDEDVLGRVFGSSVPMPLVRVARSNEAEAIAKRLNALGVRTDVVADSELLGATPPTRIRAVEFGDEAAVFVLFNSGERVNVAFGDVRLIVIGSIYERRSESAVQRKSDAPVPDSAVTSRSDSGVLDVYAGGENAGYRITTNGFDFSCLGDEMELLASLNLQKLAVKLQERFSRARVDAEYHSHAALLNQVWPPTTVNDSRGVQRVGFKVERSKGELTTNAEQFTKYSRLRAMCG